LEDISNLESVYLETRTVPYCKKTGVELQKISLDQWFLKVSQQTVDQLSDQLAFGQIKIYPELYKQKLEDLLLDDLSLCISRQYKIGARLPLAVTKSGEDIVLNQEKLFALYQDNSNKEDSFVLGMVLLNLFWDGRLPKKFTMEQVVDLLFAPSLQDPAKNTLQLYTEILVGKLSLKGKMEKEVQQLLQFSAAIDANELLLNKNKDFQIAELFDILDASFLCERAGDLYMFTLDKVYPEQDYNLCELHFDSSFFVLLSDFFVKEHNVLPYALQ
jgi:valyl-tRNA synthetase